MAFTLVRRTTILGHLGPVHVNQPWFEARFEPAAAFEEVRGQFERATRLLLEEERVEEFDALWSALLEGGLRLMPDDGSEPIEDFIIHFDGDSCRFRY